MEKQCYDSVGFMFVDYLEFLGCLRLDYTAKAMVVDSFDHYFKFLEEEKCFVSPGGLGIKINQDGKQVGLDFLVRDFWTAWQETDDNSSAQQPQDIRDGLAKVFQRIEPGVDLLVKALAKIFGLGLIEEEKRIVPQ